MDMVQQLKALAEKWRADGHAKPAEDILEVLALFAPVPGGGGCVVLIKRAGGADFHRCGRPATHGTVCQMCSEAVHGAG